MYLTTLYKIIQFRKESLKEIEFVTQIGIKTVLETISEVKNNPKLVRKKFANFTFYQMKTMTGNDLGTKFILKK